MGDWADTERLNRIGRIFDSETGPVDPDLQREAQIGYYAAITQVDYEYGRLRETMFSHGLDRSNTIVMFVCLTMARCCATTVFSERVGPIVEVLEFRLLFLLPTVV